MDRKIIHPCVQWAHNTTTQGLHRTTIHKNTFRESVQTGLINVAHIAGAVNPADFFTKEMKDAKHMYVLLDAILAHVPLTITTSPLNFSESYT